MNKPINIIAIGGGGFTHQTDPELEDYLLDQLTLAKPSIGFIPTASGDSAIKTERFYQRFKDTACTLSHLELFGSVSNVHEWILAQNLIYVGGGNTKSMLGVWREWNLGPMLLEAAHQGTILSGVSAGAVCWFETAFSDSAGTGYSPLACLGFNPGSCCPHYSTEPTRSALYEKSIQVKHTPAGIGIDDGVAVHLRNAEVVQVISARTDAHAYRVSLCEKGELASSIM